MDFDDYDEYLKSYQTKYHYGSDKKNKFSLSLHLQIDEKSIMLKRFKEKK